MRRRPYLASRTPEGRSGIIELKGIVNGIILDSVLQEAYYEDTLLNAKMTGEFPVLSGGNTDVGWTGGNAVPMYVVPRWVSL